jgi:uncharacterized protein YndB with AHSA1/START domain
MSIREEAVVRAVIKRRVAAPRERVFQAMTQAEHLQRWFFPSIDGEAVPHAEVDLRVGGRYRIAMYRPDGDITAMVGGSYHEVQPPEKLVFSWAWEAPQADSSETLVTVELHDVQGGTQIIITHERFPGQTGQQEHTIGWNCALERFVLLMEAGETLHVSALAGDPCRS